MHRFRSLTIVLALAAAVGRAQPAAPPTAIEAPRSARGSAEQGTTTHDPVLDTTRLTRQLLVTLPQRTSRRFQSAGSTPRGYAGTRGYRTSARVRRVAARLAKIYDLRRVDEWPIEALDVHCVVYEVSGSAPLDALIERLAADPRVESVQRMELFEVLAQDYDDPYFHLQLGMESMQIQQAHRWARGEGVEVAVIDTGIDVTHPELERRVVTAENFVDADRAHFVEDIHGTAVAGIIASAANNGIGIVGVAPAVHLLALKACWPREQGAVAALCSSFTLAKAISFAISKRPEILNLSLTGPADRLLSRLLSRALDDGMIVIGAVDPTPGARPGFPSNLERVIAVSASGRASLPARLAPAALERELSAPGDEVLTTMPGGTYDFLSGSSLAAAHVSGLIALLLEQDRRLSTDRLLAILRDSGGDSRHGVNGCLALSRLRPNRRCPEVAAPQPLATPRSRPAPGADSNR